MPLAALWPASCCTSLTGSVSSSSHWQVGPSGRRVRSPKSTQHEAGRLCQGSRWAWPAALQLPQEPAWFAEDPRLHPGITPHRFPRLPHFSTVLPGGCPACDTHALQRVLLCLERLYTALPSPKGTSFDVSRTLLEDAADAGALAIARKVTHPKGWDLVLPAE